MKRVREEEEEGRKRRKEEGRMKDTARVGVEEQQTEAFSEAFSLQ